MQSFLSVCTQMLCKAEKSTTMMSSLISRLVRSIVKYSYLWWHFLLNIIKPFEYKLALNQYLYMLSCAVSGLLFGPSQKVIKLYKQRSKQIQSFVQLWLQNICLLHSTIYRFGLRISFK